MKAFLIMANETDGLVLTNKRDAHYAATGETTADCFGVNTLADQFREIFAQDEDQFSVVEIEIPDGEEAEK